MTHPIAYRLRAELATTLTRLRRLDGHPGDMVGVAAEDPTDLIDNAQAAEQRELGHLAATRLTDRARRLRAALGRVERGEYGICEECGEDIAHTRLIALPDVGTCLACQQRRENSPF
jgi:RNA polymerase-binding transcription factor DksA